MSYSKGQHLSCPSHAYMSVDLHPWSLYLDETHGAHLTPSAAARGDGVVLLYGDAALAWRILLRWCGHGIGGRRSSMATVPHPRDGALAWCIPRQDLDGVVKPRAVMLHSLGVEMWSPSHHVVAAAIALPPTTKLMGAASGKPCVMEMKGLGVIISFS